MRMDQKTPVVKQEDNFMKFLDNITSNSLMDYENEMTKKAQHLPPIPTEMQDAIQLLSLLITSKDNFPLCEKIVKYSNFLSLQ